MQTVKTVLFVFAAMLFCVCRAEPAPVRVEGGRLSAAGKELRLRGINWGWWHLKGTEYTEEDMKNQAAWGANMLRLAFTYIDVTDLDGSWNEKRFAKLDEVVRWAGKYNQYVILDLHVAPGGQNLTAYTDGGKNLLWTEAAKQEHFLNLWRELARRYRDNPVVAAYELMNEPRTARPTPELLAELNRKAIAAIREIDPDKVIVVTGDNMSNAQDLVDVIRVRDDNILYTFHFYEGALSGPWRRNIEGRKISGTGDWKQIELEFTVPDDVAEIALMLRSSRNSGTAWFDDITVTDDAGNLLDAYSFDGGTSPFSVERAPHTVGSFDARTGHRAPGSLRVSGTPDYNGFVGPHWKVDPGRGYRITGWVKLDQATGDTFLAAAMFGSRRISSEQLREKLKPAVDFSRKYNVPLWVGEFSMTRSDRQPEEIRERIALFEEYGFSWSYWNFHETTGPTTMALQAQKRTGGDYPVNLPLLEVLKQFWALNGK